MKQKLKDEIRKVIQLNSDTGFSEEIKDWNLTQNAADVLNDLETAIDKTFESEKWTKEEIRNWLVDVIILWDEENEKGESEGKEQLNFLIKELTECKQSLNKTDE